MFLANKPKAGKLSFHLIFFQIPNEPPWKTILVSVMMPFEVKFSGTYEAIKGACSHGSLRSIRADNIWDHSMVIQDMFSLIFRRRV